MLKKKSRHITLLVVAMLLVTGSALAQPPGQGSKHGEGKCPRDRRMMIPDLTEAQKEQMKELRVELMKAVQPLRNQMGEMKARLRTLSTSDKVNMTEINRVIDDIGKMRTQMMKLRVQHRQDVRKLLTEEQRVFFDVHKPSHRDGPSHAGPHHGRKAH